MQISNFQTMPCELIQLIGTFLEPESIPKAAALCTRWRESLNDHRILGLVLQKKFPNYKKNLERINLQNFNEFNFNSRSYFLFLT